MAGIAARAEKELRYHLRHNSQWLVRLGDGTEESHAAIAAGSVDALWPYTGEMFAADTTGYRVSANVSGAPILTRFRPTGSAR